MRLDVVTIFPAYLDPLRLSLIGKAREQGLLDVHVHDLRDFTTDRHRSVDDTPYGGGPGMVMRAEPWARALEHVVAAGPVSGASAPLLVVPTPAGTRFTQARARELSGEPWLAFACGRYEGLDERILLHARGRMRVLEVSLGDFVLNGGEVAVLAVVEAVVRLLPGVVGNAESLLQESHEDGLLDYPVYTRPPTWHGHDVPGALLSGHHERIARWRRDERLRRTARARPDLVARLDQALLDDADRAVLADAVLADAVLADAVPSDAVQPPGAAVADWTVAPAAERPGPAPATGGVERGEPHRPRRS